MKTLRKTAALIFATAVITTTCASAVDVNVNNTRISFDVEPQIINERTMVPMRAIFEVLGANVDWDGNMQTITATRGNDTILLTIGSDIMTVNGDTKILDSAPVMADNRTLVPVRAISEALGSDVGWDDSTRTVNIIDNSGMVNLNAATKYAPAWKTAYSDFLNGQSGSFDLIYLTDDDIPEIVIAENGYRESSVRIYTYSEGTVKAITREDGSECFGIFGIIHYKERGNLIYTIDGVNNLSTVVMSISNNIAHTEHILLSDGETATWNGDPISISAFNNEIERITIDDKIAGYDYDSDKIINSTNIKAALGL